MKRKGGNPGPSEDTEPAHALLVAGTEAGTHLLQKAEGGSEYRLPWRAHLLLFPRKRFPEEITPPDEPGAGLARKVHPTLLPRIPGHQFREEPGFYEQLCPSPEEAWLSVVILLLDLKPFLLADDWSSQLWPLPLVIFITVQQLPLPGHYFPFFLPRGLFL